MLTKKYLNNGTTTVSPLTSTSLGAVDVLGDVTAEPLFLVGNGGEGDGTFL